MLIALPLTAGKQTQPKTEARTPLPVSPLSFDLPGDDASRSGSGSIASQPTGGSNGDVPISDPFAANLESMATVPTTSGAAPGQTGAAPNSGTGATGSTATGSQPNPTQSAPAAAPTTARPT
ncbi:hypothetical protein AMR42_14130, partial [Limnothrix sp. PR1529]